MIVVTASGDPGDTSIDIELELRIGASAHRVDDYHGKQMTSRRGESFVAADLRRSTVFTVLSRRLLFRLVDFICAAPQRSECTT